MDEAPPRILEHVARVKVDGQRLDAYLAAFYPDMTRTLVQRVIDNGGDLAQLEAQMDDLWAWLHTLPASVPPVIDDADA